MKKNDGGSLNIEAGLKELDKISQERWLKNTVTDGRSEQRMRVKVSDLRRILLALGSGGECKHEYLFHGNNFLSCEKCGLLAIDPVHTKPSPTLAEELEQWCVKNDGQYPDRFRWRTALIAHVETLLEQARKEGFDAGLCEVGTKYIGEGKRQAIEELKDKFIRLETQHIILEGISAKHIYGKLRREIFGADSHDK